MISSPPSPRHARQVAALLAALLAILLTVGLAGCSLPGRGTAPTPTATPSAIKPRPSPEQVFGSQFTRDGTFQSHIDIGGVDFVFTLWPTKSTPRTNEWYARGKKFFSFTLTAYDLDRRLRDPFATKRKVYLSRIQVSSRTKHPDGDRQSPYRLDAQAQRITFDPEPVTSEHGMLITSPKGAFELRNQTIRPVRVGTVGLYLDFRATVSIERSAGTDQFDKRVLRQRVPITIFPGRERTVATPIPVDAN